jgi:endonuclease/exonuclease/phosphatase family metal-dependent hydrolase
MNLRVLTYNIHRAIGTDRRFRPDRITRILASHAPDIVLLQEVDDGVPRSRRLDMARVLAEELDYEFVVAGHNVSLREGRYGNAILSRFPISRARNLNLSVGRKKRRGCQYASVEVSANGSGPVRVEVFNLHLGLSARERRQQLGLLMSTPEFSRIAHESPCIVGGDFNDWRSQLQPPMIHALRFASATGSGKSRKGTSALKTYPAFSPQGSLDRIYFRGGGLELKSAYRCRHAVSKVASDHLPVIADFVLENGAESTAG